jgi:hypothetical protein
MRNARTKKALSTSHSESEDTITKITCSRHQRMLAGMAQVSPQGAQNASRPLHSNQRDAARAIPIIRNCGGESCTYSSIRDRVLPIPSIANTTRSLQRTRAICISFYLLKPFLRNCSSHIGPCIACTSLLSVLHPHWTFQISNHGHQCSRQPKRSSAFYQPTAELQAARQKNRRCKWCPMPLRG